MRLVLYYMLHSLKNQIKKLFRSYVAIIFLVCLVVGFGVGIFASSVDEAVSSDTDGYYGDEYYEDDYYEDSEHDEYYEEEEELSPEMLENIVGFAAGGIILIYLAVSFAFGDKAGTSVFEMADVNLLFQAPMKPQSVLLFRIICKIGLNIFASVYFVFQIPNFHMEFGIPLNVCFSMLFAWILLLIYGNLLSVFSYSVSSTYSKVKKYLFPATLCFLAVIALVYNMYRLTSGLDLYSSAVSFFNSKASNFIPIWGWLKGIVVYTYASDYTLAAIFSLLSVIGIAALIWFVWSLKVDFYEDAIASSEEKAALVEAQKSEGKNLKKRDKERAERIYRNKPLGGFGASVIFTKEMYNRFRFATLHFFTKTMLLYLAIAILLCLILKAPLYLAVLLVSLCAFFRGFGNSIVREITMETFIMIPEKPFVKVFFAHLANFVSSVLDALPAMIIIALSTKSNFLYVFLYLLIIASIDLYTSSIITAIDLSLPSSIAISIKQAITILFAYFGSVPIMMIGMLFGGFTNSILLGFVFGAIGAVLISVVAILISSHILKTGKK